MAWTKLCIASFLALIHFSVAQQPNQGPGLPKGGRTPDGCRMVSTDAGWPSPAEWSKALPGVIPRGPVGKMVFPDYTYRAKSIEDVQRAVKFAAGNNIRISIIASGHDYLGRNNAASGLSLDVSLLDGIRVEESFEPTTKGTERVKRNSMGGNVVPKPGAQAAVTFGAALGTQPLNDAISKNKLYTLGAAHGSVVVAGGWGQGGGHSPMTPFHGLGVDQWLEAKIVTADGDLKIANAVSNPDLFWAIRGGGPGNWGVVVEATMKAYPDVPITTVSWWFNATTPIEVGKYDRNPGFVQATKYFMNNLPAVHGQGVSGYYYMMEGKTLRGFSIHPADQSGADRANAVWKPHLEKMQGFGGTSPFQSRAYEYKNFKEFYDKTYGSMEDEMGGKVPKGSMYGSGKRNLMASSKFAAVDMPLQKRHGPGETGGRPKNKGNFKQQGRLLSAEHLQRDNVIDGFNSTLSFWAFLPAPGQNVGGKLPKGDDTSTHPGWRKGMVSISCMDADSLRKFAPELGVYQNEARADEVDYKEQFWGGNYAKLSKIKTRYDPNQLFWISPGINADQMHVGKSGRVCTAGAKHPEVANARIAPALDAENEADISDFDAFFGKLELTGARFPPPGKYLGMNK